ncbi:MAG: phosphopantetheine-binding protein, partial [Polyangiaceae bacterium]
TETVITAMTWHARDVAQCVTAYAPIGRVIGPRRGYVLDRDLNPVPNGVTGELYLAGLLARGYLEQPGLSAERFLPDPFADAPGARMYRTGDRVRRLPDGNIEFLGRADHQVKIRGFRVELGEIEAQLAEHPGVRQAVVVARADAGGEKRLVAYCVASGGAALAPEVLHAHLKAVLPHYMIPAVFVQMTELPLTANGKVDRKRLPEPQQPTEQPVSRSDGSARDDLDRSFLAVFQTILGRPEISIDDDFFALGGDSMMAIRLVKELKKSTGIDYPLSALFGAPTIRQLVAQVGEAAERAASIVQLNAVRTGVPIYCLAGVQLYKELADHFTDRPIFGIYAKRELAGIQAQDQGTAIDVPVDVLVQTYVDAVARHATQKKLVLVGLSFGGLMALEVAAALNQRGFEVEQVAMFDTIPTGAYVRTLRKAITDCAQRFSGGEAVDTLKHIAGRAYARFAASVPAPRSWRPHGAHGGRESVQGQAFRQMTRAFDTTGKSYALDALLIKATRKTFGIGASLKHDYGFGNLIQGNLALGEVDADHRGMMQGPAVTRVFEILADYLAVSKPLGKVMSPPPPRPANDEQRRPSSAIGGE